MRDAYFCNCPFWDFCVTTSNMIAKIKNILSTKKHSLVNLLIHLSALLLFILPEIITNIDDNRPVPSGVIIKTTLYIIIFYVNYFLVDKFLDRKGGKWYCLGTNLLLLTFASTIVLLSSHGYTDKNFHPVKKPPVEHKRPPKPGSEPQLGAEPFKESLNPPPPHKQVKEKNKVIHAAGRLSRDLFIAILVIALAFAVRVTSRWLNEQRNRANLIASQREIEINGLKSQINPHFLFNTLNTIYALIAVDQAKAQSAVHELSRLMRYTLYETSEQVTMQQEIDFIKNYLSLMKMRMNVKRPIDVSLACENANDYLIAPLLFIPVIENAFKYGNTGNVEDPIKIDISLTDGVVRCYTFNHFDSKPQESASGIGLANLRQRLNLIYGSAASIATITHDNTYQVEMTINLNGNSSETPSLT